jgi:hypothetical protein
MVLASAAPARTRAKYGSRLKRSLNAHKTNFQGKKMSDAIIDTNVLYYLSSVSNPASINVTELDRRVFADWNNVYVSELSLMELIAHEGFSINDIQKVLKYITDRKFRIVNFLPRDNTILNIFNLDLTDEKSFKKLKDAIVKKKIDIETELLFFVIISAVVMLSLFFHDRQETETSKKNILIQTMALVEGNFDFTKEIAKHEIIEFYNTNDSKTFKINVRSFIYSLLYVASLNNNMAKANIFIDELSPEIDAKTVKADLLSDVNKKDIFIDKIFTKINGEKPQGILSKKIFWDEIENVKELFINEMGLSGKEVVASYFARYLDKFFKTDKRFDKNNLFDSQFLEYYPQFEIITLDDEFISSIEDIDWEYYNRLNDLRNNVKIVEE